MAASLEKQGSTLEEAEEGLRMLTKDGVLTKEAIVDAFGRAFGSLADLGIALPLLLGAGTGELGYEAYKHMANTDKSLQKKRTEMDMIQAANAKLQRELEARRQAELA